MNLSIFGFLLVPILLPGMKADFLEVTLLCHQKSDDGGNRANDAVDEEKVLTLSKKVFDDHNFLSPWPHKGNGVHKFVTLLSTFLERTGLTEAAYRNLGQIKVSAGHYKYNDFHSKIEHSIEIHNPVVKHPVYLRRKPEGETASVSVDLPGYLSFASNVRDEFDVFEQMPEGEDVEDDFVYFQYKIGA